MYLNVYISEYVYYYCASPKSIMFLFVWLVVVLFVFFALLVELKDKDVPYSRVFPCRSHVLPLLKSIT